MGKWSFSPKLGTLLLLEEQILSLSVESQKGGESKYHISLVIGQRFFLPKQSLNSRPVLKDRSRFMELCRKGKTCIIAKFCRTD